MHISNIFKEDELDLTVGKNSFLTASDGKNYKTKDEKLSSLVLQVFENEYKIDRLEKETKLLLTQLKTY